MNTELPSFANVCATIQQELRRKVMSIETKAGMFESRAYVSNHKQAEERINKSKMTDLK